MTNEEKKKAFCMLVDGATYQEVANELGISKQAIHQKFGSLINGKAISIKCGGKYINIMKFMTENGVSRKEFANSIGVSYQCFRRVLTGEQEPSKKTIDKILKFTGMTYEEAFFEE